MLGAMLDTVRVRLRESGAAFAAVFGNRDLRLVQLSWAGSVTAYWVFIVALSLFAYEEGGAAAVGLVGLLRVLPAVVASPFAAVLGDRYPRQRVLMVVNIARTATIAVAAALAFADAPPVSIYLLAGVVGMLQSVFRPTQSALLPLLARTPEELTASNLVLTTIEALGVFMGPAIGGLLLATTSTDTVLAASSIAFLVSALLVSGIRVEREVPQSFAREPWASRMLAGFSTIWQDASLRMIVLLYGAQTLVAGALNVLIVVSALELLDLGEAGIGFLNSAVGIGGLIGGVAAAMLVGRHRLASDFGVGLVLWGIPIVLIGLYPEPPIALILLGIVGAGTILVDVSGITLLQRSVPDEVLSRVMGVVQSVFVGTLGLGAILAPLLIEAFGVRGALVATGALLPILAAFLWRRLARMDEAGPPPRQLELVRETPLFRPLPPATAEQLAASLSPVRVAAGEDVFRQGDSGDRFYLVDSGEVVVSVDGQPVQRLGPGAYFGEIALLRDVPRTATVTAATDTDVLALERDEFIAAVTGHAQSAEVADAVIASRLGGLRPGVASV
jgi:MFS family permease